MRRFAQLFNTLDQTTRTNVKVAALEDYFLEAQPADAAWALFFLTGNRLPAAVRSADLRGWMQQLTGLPDWLVDDAYAHVGDLAETLALLYPEVNTSKRRCEIPLRELVEEWLQPLADWDAPLQFPLLQKAWASLPASERFLFNKMLTGGFRVGVSRRLVTRALANLAGVEPAIMAHRLMGTFRPTPEHYLALFAADAAAESDPARPYPFYLASPLELKSEDAAALEESLGAREQWLAEWKWDGLRAQLIKRQGQLFLWSRGEEMLTERFPEIIRAAAGLPNGTVLDGEVTAWLAGQPLGFAQLQKRIGRKKPSDAILREAPAAFVAYDVLEEGGADARTRPQWERRKHLEALLEKHAPGLEVSPLLTARSWASLGAARAESRQRNVEGLMLKRKDAPYRAGRPRGDWWKWKVAPLTLDAVLVYAQAGHGRRSGLYTDYTFALRDLDTEGALVPFAKAYSGLTDAEIKKLDRWIKQHTRSSHGPVRVVEPQQVFEIAFEGIAESPRHKSGLAVRFPRIHRWRTDKQPAEADTLQTARKML